MARTMSPTAVSRVNRRFLLLALILSVLSGVLAYAAFSRSGEVSVSAEDVPVLVARQAIPAGTRITAEMLEVQQIPASAVGDQALGSSELAVGQVARFPIAANEQVLLFKIVGTSVGAQDALTYVIEEGMRGLAINVGEVIGVGGLLLPGDNVDVLWVPFAGAPSFTLLSDIEVTAVSQAILDVPAVAPGLQGEEQEGGAAVTTDGADGQRIRASEAELQPDALTVTLMVSVEQINTLFCAEAYALANGGSIRLALRSFGDTTPATVDAPACPPIELLLEILLANEVPQ